MNPLSEPGFHYWRMQLCTDARRIGRLCILFARMSGKKHHVASDNTWEMFFWE